MPTGQTLAERSPIRKRRHQPFEIAPECRLHRASAAEAVPGGDQLARGGAPELVRAPPQDAEAEHQGVFPGEGLRAVASCGCGGFGEDASPPKVATRRSAMAAATGAMPSWSGRPATSASLME